MSQFRRFEMIEQSSPYFIRETSICKALPFPSFFVEEDEMDHLSYALDLLSPTSNYTNTSLLSSSPFEIFDSVLTDLTQIEHTPYSSSYRRIQRRVNSGSGASELLCLNSLYDRVAALESSFDRLAKVKSKTDRKYTLKAEIKDDGDRNYKWTAEIKGEKKKDKEKEIEKYEKKKKEEEEAVKKKYKWTAEFEKKGHKAPILKKYSIDVSNDGYAGECSKSEKKKKEGKGEKFDKKSDKKGDKNSTRTVEIEEIDDDHHGPLVLRQKAPMIRTLNNRKGKRKELSPQDAAMMIQMTFRAHLIRRSQSLRALRDLAIAKTRLREIRKLFNNFSYRRRIAHDAEERQKFSERIIVLLLTIDAIEVADRMVKAAKRSMVDELEVMLDAVDPQPAGAGRSLSMKRRTFDLPDAGIQKEIAAGVAQVVQMLNDEENSADTSSFERL